MKPNPKDDRAGRCEQLRNALQWVPFAIAMALALVIFTAGPTYLKTIDCVPPAPDGVCFSEGIRLGISLMAALVALIVATSLVPKVTA